MDFAQQFLEDNGAGLVQSLVTKFGFSEDKAGSFIGEMVKRIVEMLTGGGFDINTMMGTGGVSSLLSKIDIGALAGAAGVEQNQAEQGVKEVAPKLIDSLKSAADNPDDLMNLLGGKGGMMGKLGDIAGGLFGK